jgi:CubicO group peptidase (beta-lactamase class C family)
MGHNRMNVVFVVISTITIFMCSPNHREVGLEIVKGELGAKLDDYLTRLVPFGFWGALLVVKEGDTLINKGYGMAVDSEGILNTAQTVFSTGSITKQFTAAAIMKLEMQGKLNTFDLINKYLPDVPDDKAGITLHNLLTHTSGVIGSSGRDFVEAPRDETVKKILQAPLQFKPGEKFSYSNCGYSLLAAIVEIVSRQSYEAFLNANLFQPAGMQLTGYRIPDWSKRVVAHWYVKSKDNLTPLGKPYPQWNLLGNGGILSTTEDMYRWHLALSGEKVLSAEAKKKLYTPFLNDYAYGWDVMKTRHGQVIKHDGGSSLGIAAEFRRYTDAGVVFVLFSNRDGIDMLFSQGLVEKVDDMIFGENFPLPPVVQEMAPEVLKKFTGTYNCDSGSQIDISLKKGDLILIPKGQEAINLVFFPDGADSVLLGSVNERTNRVFSALQKKDFQQLEEFFGAGDKAEEIISQLKDGINQLEGMIGEIQNITTLGTIPGKAENTFTTIVVLEGEKNRMSLRVLWENEKSFDIEPMFSADFQSLTLRPVTETEFAGYDIGLARTTRIRFAKDDQGVVTGLIVPKKDRDIHLELQK